MDIYEFENYKKYTLKRFEALPKKGYGQLKKLSEHLEVSTTFVSQVFQGEKELSLEQAVSVCEFLNLSETESEYFLKLVSLARAGSEKLRKILKNEIMRMKARSQKVHNRLSVQKVLPDEDKAIFYSDWFYSAIRLLIGIEGFQGQEKISEYFGLHRTLVNEVLQFLLKSELIVNENGILKVGPSRTHLDSESPFIKFHHTHWRMKALEQVKYPSAEKLHYSSPMTLGRKEVETVRARLVKTIEEVGKIIDPSPNEELMCLNIDWFKVHGK